MFTKSLSKVFTPEGKSCHLSVKVTGKPEPDVQWFRNGQPVCKTSRSMVTRDGDTSTLILKNVGVTDEGLYSVKATNTAGIATCHGELLMESEYFRGAYILEG